MAAHGSGQLFGWLFWPGQGCPPPGPWPSQDLGPSLEGGVSLGIPPDEGVGGCLDGKDPPPPGSMDG